MKSHFIGFIFCKQQECFNSSKVSNIEGKRLHDLESWKLSITFSQDDADCFIVYNNGLDSFWNIDFSQKDVESKIRTCKVWNIYNIYQLETCSNGKKIQANSILLWKKQGIACPFGTLPFRKMLWKHQS